MAQSTFRWNNWDFTFSDEDVVNPDDCVYQGEYNPHNVIPYLLHDHGSTLAVVFADSLQDALDIAADEDRLEQYLIAEEERKDYCEEDDKTGKTNLDTFGDDGAVSFLGNASEPFDIESLGCIKLPIPTRSFCAQFNASQQQKVS